MKRDLVPLRPATVIVCDDPMQTFIEPHQVRAARDGEILADMLPGRPGRWVCIVGTRIIPPDLWHHMPRPGSVVQWRPLAQGGDGGGSRAILQIIAVIAITYFTAGMAAGFATTALKVGLQIAATALINNLVPLGAPNASGGRSLYSAQAQSNSARLGQPIPEIFGFDNSFPDLAASPYSYYIENNQIIHVTLMVGVGQYHICRVQVGDTNITIFDEAEVVRIGPGQSTMDGPGTGVEDIGDQTLVDTLWVNSPDVVSIELRPGNYAGPYTACSPERTVDRIGVDLMLPRGMPREAEITWRVEARLINDFEEPLADWIILGSHVYLDETNPIRDSWDYDVSPGRYEVRVIRTDGDETTDLSEADQLDWLALRGHLVDSDVNVPDCTLIGIKIRATGQLSGGLRFRVMCYRMLPVWDGSNGWSDPQVTRNPAWAFAQVLRSRGYPEDRIDLTQLLALSEVWDARYDSFDYKFGEQISVFDALAMIAKVGRAVPVPRGGRWTIVRDSPQTLPVAAYGMRNIVRGSMQMKPALAQTDSMRTLDLEYADHRRQTWITVTAQIHNGVIYGYRGDAQRAALGIPAPDENRRGRIKFPGIIGFNHAMRTVTYTLADRYYRSVDVDFDVELDGQLPAPLDLVLYQHDVGNFGQTGDVVSWDDGTLTLTTTEPLEWGDGTHAIRLQRPIGSITSAISVTRGADDYTAVLASDPGFTLLTDDAARERTRYVFGPQTAVGALAKVRGIVPSDERRIGMRLVLEDDRVHSVDAQWIAPDPLPPCIVAEEEVEPFSFIDEFTGSGLIEDHTPDAAPAGFAWEPAIRTIVLSGGVAQPGDNFGGVAYGDIAPVWTVTRPFFIEITATPYAHPLAEPAVFMIVSENGAVSSSVSISSSAPGEWRAHFDPQGNAKSYVITNAEHTARLVFNDDDTCSAYVDGVFQETFTGTPPPDIGKVQINIDGEFLSLSQFCTISRIEISTL